MTNDEQPVKPANEARELDLVLAIGSCEYVLDPRIVQSEAIYIAQILARGVRSVAQVFNAKTNTFDDQIGPREIVALQLRPVAQSEGEVAK